MQTLYIVGVDPSHLNLSCCNERSGWAAHGMARTLTGCVDLQQSASTRRQKSSTTVISPHERLEHRYMPLLALECSLAKQRSRRAGVTHRSITWLRPFDVPSIEETYFNAIGCASGCSPHKTLSGKRQQQCIRSRATVTAPQRRCTQCARVKWLTKH